MGLPRWFVAGLLASTSLVAAQNAAPPSPQRRVPAKPQALADDPLLSTAAVAVESGKLQDLGAKAKSQLEPLISALNPADYDELTTLTSLREFARYFARLKEPDGDQVETLKWLTRHPQLLNRLMLNVSRYDAPDRVLEILTALRADLGDRLEEFPDLTAAMCLVWDVPSKQEHGEVRAAELDRDGANPVSQPRALMQFYVNARLQLRIDPQRLPVQLATYLVDNVAAPDEIAWALSRYKSRDRIGSAFFDVQYDIDFFSGNKDLRLADGQYSLQNIFLKGGICGDQAYFATQVSRSVGVPATICTGKGADEGTGHAWVGFLDVRGNKAAWNFDEGRYVEHRYFRGQIVDPQTRQQITDSDVSLLAELWATPTKDRLASAALARCADLTDEAQEPSLLMEAINLSPGNRQAWQSLADLSAKLKLSAKQSSEFTEVVTRFAARQYPDFAFAILKKSISGRGTIQQIAALDQMQKVFANERPDLAAELRLAQGDLYQKDKHPNEALSAYGDALQRTNLAPLILETMDHIDPFLRQSGDLDRLAGIYQLAWQKMPQPEQSIAVPSTPYYRIGERYAKLLEELHQTNAAQIVRSRLESLTQTVTLLRK